VIATDAADVATKELRFILDPLSRQVLTLYASSR